MKTEFFAVPAEAGFYQAIAKGFYQEEGITLDIREGTGAENPVLPLMSGQVEFATTSTTGALRHLSQGMDIVILFAYNQHLPRALMLHESDPAKTWEDLDGRQVWATPGFPWIDFVEDKYGIDLNVQVRNASLAQFLADPEKRSIIEVYVTNQPYVVAREGVPYRVMPLRDTGYDPMKVVLCRREFLESHPELAEKFRRASIRGFEDYFTNDPAPGNGLMAEQNPGLDDDLIAFYRDVLIADGYIFGSDLDRPFWQVSPARLEQEADALKRVGVLSATINPDALLWNPTAASSTP